MGSYSCFSEGTDVCTSTTHNCDVNADCVPYLENLSTYWCKCRTGLVGWGLRGQCRDIDECDEGIHTCTEYQVCDNLDRSKQSNGYNCIGNAYGNCETNTECGRQEVCKNGGCFCRVGFVPIDHVDSHLPDDCYRPNPSKLWPSNKSTPCGSPADQFNLDPRITFNCKVTQKQGFIKTTCTFSCKG